MIPTILLFQAWTLPDLGLLTDLWSTPSRSCTPIFSGFPFKCFFQFFIWVISFLMITPVFFYECCHYHSFFPALNLPNLWTSSTPMEPWSPQSSMCRCSDNHLPLNQIINIIITLRFASPFEKRVLTFPISICSQGPGLLSSSATWTSIQTADPHRSISLNFVINKKSSIIKTIPLHLWKTSKTE